MIALLLLAQLAAAPKAAATVTCPAGGQTCTFDGRASSGARLAFRWKFYKPLTAPAEPKVTVNFPFPGPDSATLYVTDSAKRVSQKLLRFTVLGLGLPPVATIPPKPPSVVVRVDTVRIVRIDSVIRHDTAVWIVQVPHPNPKHTGMFIDSSSTDGMRWVFTYQLMGKIGTDPKTGRLAAWRPPGDWRPGLEPLVLGVLRWQGNYASDEIAATALILAPPAGWPWLPQ